MLLTGIMPIVFVPYDANGMIDEKGLRNIVRFELDGGVHAIGINGFATEAYKLTDAEREQTVAVTAEEINGAVPLIIGIAAESTEVAIQQAAHFAQYNPAALMVLPPSTMQLSEADIVKHYVRLGNASATPIMIQQAPHIPRYTHTRLSAESLATIHQQAPNVCYFKIEGPGSAERIANLMKLVNRDVVGLFGGGGGITLLPELRAGANGAIPGVGFNEIFLQAWTAWESGDEGEAERLIHTVQPLVSAVSAPGHEFSLLARKYMMKRAGYIDHMTVRSPTAGFTDGDAANLDAIVNGLGLRISQG